MRKLIPTLAMASLFVAGSLPAVIAAPVEGFEELYNAAFAACTPPEGTPEACEAAIVAYSSALIAAGIAPELALASFTELRAEVAAAGGGDVIEALFEELLPDSGAVIPELGGPAVTPSTAS